MQRLTTHLKFAAAVR